MVDGSNNTYEEIFTYGKYLRFLDFNRFLLYPNLNSPLNVYDRESDEFLAENDCNIWFSWHDRRDSFRIGMASIWPSNRSFDKKLDHIFDILF